MYDDRVDLLYDLLGAIFRSSGELERFLVLEGVHLAASRSVATQQRSRSTGAYEVARALVDQELADDGFFAALERRSPGRAADIRSVANRFSARSRSAGSGTAPREEPSPYADFAARLSVSLSALDSSDDAERSLDPAHWPWTGTASVLGSFDPLRLRPLPGASASSLTALSALRELVTANHEGSWVLRDDVRAPALSRLFGSGMVEAALEATADLADRRRNLVRRLVGGAPLSPALMERGELVDLDAVLGWLAPVMGAPLPVRREDVRAAAERRLLIDPLRSLVGAHFRGRAEEVALLDAHLGGGTSDQLLLLRGAGGSGKSTLLGFVILQLEQHGYDRPVSFAYLDFDKARHDPRDRTSLLRQLAQQLRLLHSTSAAAAQFAAIESVYGGTDVDRAAELLDIDVHVDASQLLDTLCARLREVSAGTSGSPPPLLLFLDTFEEVVGEGPGAVRSVGQLLAGLWERLPDMRVVVAGRSVGTALPGRTRYRELSDLDPVAAGAVLEHQGVTDPALRRLVIDTFGGNPLTLRLAAEALRRAGGADEAFGDVLPRTKALADAALEEVQGMLYSRILGHIRDTEVAGVAHPGLAVRLVTVELIRDVLAEPCGLDPNRAEAIFAKLRLEMSLFDPQPDGSLRHRQDVRRIMMRTMRDDPQRASKVAEIHRRAASYYASRTGPEATAELIYHRLMTDEDPRLLNHLWDGSLGMSLASALEEPLPPRAHRWLQRRVLADAVLEDVEEWEQEDWEANAYSRAVSWLSSDEPRAALDVLAERSERLVPSRLYAVEVAAWLGLDELQRAADALERGLLNAQGASDHRAALELAEQAVAVRTAQGDGKGLAEAGLACASLADVTGQPARGIRALASTLSGLRRHAHREHLAEVRAELARRFAQLSRPQMREDPELVREVLHVAGSEDSGVLAHAALAVGDQTGETDGVFFEDAFALTRLLQSTTPEAGTSLSELAGEVGLRRAGWETGELASLLVRTGRTGTGIALSLDYAADEQWTRNVVVSELVQPPREAIGRRLA